MNYKNCIKNKYLMKIAITLLFFFCIIISASCSCDNKEFEIKISNTILDENETFYLEVDNDVTSYSFLSNVSISTDYQWKIYTDLEGKNEIKTKNVNLNIGDNDFYLLVFSSNEVYKMFEITIRRMPMYLVTFKTNDVEVYERKYIQEKKTVQEPEVEPAKEGYTFGGWDYDFNLPITKSLTIKAKWEANVYTISFQNESIENMDITYGEQYELPEAVKEGNSFNCWSYNGNCIPQRGIWNISANVSLVSSMSPNVYTISYNANGGSVSTVSKQVEFGTMFTHPTPNKNGYEFVGWYDGNSLVESGTYSFTNNINLDAKWDLVTYDITYNLNGGNSTNVGPLQYTVETNNFTISNPMRTNYIFVGWTYNGQYLSSLTDLVIEKGTYEDIILEANWMEKNGEHILLSDADDLMKLSLNSDLWSMKIKLKNDIDCINKTIYSMGTSQIPFTGVFDGNDKILRNFIPHIEGAYGGLFGYVNNAKITNLKINSSTVILNNDLVDYFGVLIGYSENSTIKNIEIRGNYTLINSNKNSMGHNLYAGGLIGYNESEVRAVSFLGDFKLEISQSNRVGVNYVGGLIGYNNFSLLDSYADGKIEITSNNSTYVGGLVGSLSGTIFNNYSNMNILADSKTMSLNAGGLVGVVSVDSIIHNSISLGNIEVEGGSVHAGGIIGNGTSDYISDNYKNTNKTITINGVSKVTNSIGISKTMESIIQFIEENWEEEVWQFGDDGLPVLKYNKNDVLIEINSKDDLIQLQGQYLIYNYILNINVDLSDIDWNPVNIAGGTFDGNYKSINNLKISTDRDNAGLFGIIYNSNIKNLAIENADILFNRYDSSTATVGILGGKILNSKLANIYTTGNVNVSNMYDRYYAGGIVGYIQGNVYLDNIYSASNIHASGKGSELVGGLIGYLSDSTNLNLNNTYYIGSLSGTDRDGLVGYAHYLANANVTNSYYNFGNYKEGETNIGYSLLVSDIYDMVLKTWDTNIWDLKADDNPTFLSNND